MVKVTVKSELLRWARERAGLTVSDLQKKFPRLMHWESGEASPTLKQLESYANATHAPIGFLFLDKPPDEPLPIPDFRTKANNLIAAPSPDLRDTIYQCQLRQEWFRDYALSVGAYQLAFVGSRTTASSVTKTAEEIRELLNFDLQERAECSTWTDALRLFISQAERVGILVMCSGVVMNNNTRKLNPDEFRGFALSDTLAPLIFINGADSKSAQMFTLAHEIAHIWLGKTALSDTTVASSGQNAVETWCNQVAAEVLAPLSAVRRSLKQDEDLDRQVSRLARQFKVSTLVVLQRLRDAGQLSWDAFGQAYEAECKKINELPKRSGGGDFYLTTAARYSKRFSRALIESTLEGRTLYRDAYRLLGISKSETFQQLGRSLNFSN